MAYIAIEVANKFIELFRKDGMGVKHVSLQKLLYIAHGAYLALTNKPLIHDGFEAWDYGPVVPSLYHDCSSYGRNEIKTKIPFFEPIGGQLSALDRDTIANDVINQVYHHFKGYSPSQLIALTHAPGSPWEEVYENGRKSIPIPDTKITNYFKKHFLKKR